MRDTRERILQEALWLFAERGYEASSMSDIAARVGITKGALYRHFDGKRAIFDAILERMQARDREQALACGVPVEALAAGNESYRETGISSIRAFALEQFLYWTQEPFPSAFRRMLALERYRDAEMMALYQNYLCAGPLSYMEDLFSEMDVQGYWRREDAASLALEFYGAMYLLMSASDANPDKKAAYAQLEAYIDRFISTHTTKKGD